MKLCEVLLGVAQSHCGILQLNFFFNHMPQEIFAHNFFIFIYNTEITT